MTAPLAELLEMGRALGGLRWVQGPGGNVSVKTGSELWVKASGTRLRDVATEAGHARVALDVAARALAGDAAADAELFARTPRPSLETYFHMLPARVVAHTHPVGAHLYACSSAVSPPEIGAKVSEIPYVRPGRGVALAIEAVLDRAAPEQVIVLRSHGIVALAPTAARAIALTVAFDEAVRAGWPALPDFDQLVLAYSRAEEASAFDGGVVQPLPPRATNATSTTPPRYLFPDAPVCAGAVLVDALGDAPGPLAARALAATGRAGVLVDAHGRRAAFARNASQLAQTIEVLAAHDWIEDALAARGATRYLADDEPARILDMPAEQYRIRLAATSTT